MWNFELLPEQASSIASRVDTLYLVLTALSGIISLGILIAIVYFAVKYRRHAEVDRSNPITESTPLEVTWIVTLLVLSAAVFVWAAWDYFDMKTPPAGETLELYAIGKQWMWKFQHPNGVRENNTLHVPVGQPIKLMMTSQDVIHSFFVPAFRVKQDVLPGRYTTTWFEPTKTGRYHLFCTEYCGTLHSGMEGYVQVMERADYQRWLEEGETGGSLVEPGTGRLDRAPTGPLGEEDQRDDLGETAPPDAAAEPAMVEAGRALFEQLQCNACHRVDANQTQPSTGPVLESLYGRTVTLQNEREVVADEQYLRESILYPQEKIVQGYPPIMPTYQGQITEDELMQLVAYLKSLGNDGEGETENRGEGESER